jgi:alkanesulfonate monooxygenase SsuD/methylene tetrahydromethanopterin reductase-like flavin-dependent oxidoreductase (luciferase family)
MSVRFGLAYDFRNPKRWEKPWPEVFAALLDQIEYADTLGFDSVWVTEHHFAGDGYAPSPMTLLAAITMRTKRMKLSTDILLLPLYNAVRLAEEIATIDILSGGRMMLGVGMGYREVEWQTFGTSRKERVGRTEEALEVMRGAWKDGPLTYKGRFYDIRGVDVTPKPVQKPEPPLWMAATSEAAARRAARFGMNLLPQGHLSHSYEPWLDELTRLGNKPEDYRIGVIKSAYITDSRDDPMWKRVAEHERYRWDVYRPWIQEGGLYTPPPERGSLIDQSYIVGPADKVIEELERFRETLPATDIVLWGTPVGMDPKDYTPALERFARDVLPHFT